MRFTVISGPGVDDKLIALWITAIDRQAFSTAVNKIDMILRRDPLSVGVALDNARMFRVGALTVLYTVSEPDCSVQILDYLYHG